MKKTLSPVALTIAGSDCSGGAGLQADLKTFAAHDVYGMAVVTCVVAENPNKVISIKSMTARTVHEQIDCSMEGMSGIPVKTGILFSTSIIRACSARFSSLNAQLSKIVVDPVMVATSGAVLLQPDAIRALMKLIDAHADLVTPNLNEAEILVARRIRTPLQMEKAAQIIAQRFSCSVLMKGGHLRNPRHAMDFFWDGSHGSWLSSNRVRGVKTHGTGCTYSAAITANLSLGYSMLESVHRAKRFITHAIRSSHRFRRWMALNHCFTIRA